MPSNNAFECVLENMLNSFSYIPTIVFNCHKTPRHAAVLTNINGGKFSSANIEFPYITDLSAFCLPPSVFRILISVFSLAEDIFL